MSRRTDQKLTAVRLYAAGVEEIEACERAGYARPKRAAARLFKVDEDGEFADDFVRHELDGGDDADFDECDVADLPKAVLVALLRAESTPPHVLQRAATSLQAFIEQEAAGKAGVCPTCGRGKPSSQGAMREAVEEAVAKVLG